MRMYGLYRKNNLKSNLLSETKEDFLSRVLGAEKTIQKENDNIMKNLEKEAKEAGVNPDNLDVIMVQDDDK